MITDYGNQISIETVILTQEFVIGQIAAKIWLTPRSEWQTGVNNYYASVNALESMTWAEIRDTAYPLMKARLERNAKALIRLYREEQKTNPVAYLRKGRNYEMSLFLKFIELKWSFIQAALQRKGFLRKRREQAVDMESTDGLVPVSDEMEMLRRIARDLSGANAGGD